jgi:hypothetical protein
MTSPEKETQMIQNVLETMKVSRLMRRVCKVRTIKWTSNSRNKPARSHKTITKFYKKIIFQTSLIFEESLLHS